MEREAKDRSAQWLLEHQGKAMLRVAGVAGFTAVRPLRTVLSHPKVIPDGVFEVDFPGPKTVVYVLEISTYPDSEERDQVLNAVSLVLLDRGIVPEVISLVLASRGNQVLTGQHQRASTSGGTILSWTWRVVEVFNLKARDLLALNLPGVSPLVPLTILEDPPDQVFEQVRQQIEQHSPESERGNLMAIAATLAAFRYNNQTLTNIFLRSPNMLLESPLIQDLLRKNERETRLKVEREDALRAIFGCLEARRLEVPDDLRKRINAIEDLDRLWQLVPLTAAGTVEQIRQAAE